MTRRGKKLFVTFAALGAAIAGWVALNDRLSLYYHPIFGMNARNVLLTCVSGDPIYTQLVPFSDEMPTRRRMAAIDVAIACGLRAFHRDTLIRPSSESVALSSMDGLMVSFPLCAGMRRENLVAECRAAHYDSIDWLLRSGMDIDQQTSSGATPLHDSVVTPDKEMFAFLLSRGADVNYRPFENSDNGSGATILETLEKLSEGEPPFDNPQDVETWREMLLLVLNRQSQR